MTLISNDTLPLEAQLVDAMRDGLAIFDREGNLLRWNSSIVAVRLLLALVQPYRVAGESRTIGCSIGVAASPRDAADALGLFKIANMCVCREARPPRVVQGRHGWCRHETRD